MWFHWQKVGMYTKKRWFSASEIRIWAVPRFPVKIWRQSSPKSIRAVDLLASFADKVHVNSYPTNIPSSLNKTQRFFRFDPGHLPIPMFSRLVSPKGPRGLWQVSFVSLALDTAALRCWSGASHSPNRDMGWHGNWALKLDSGLCLHQSSKTTGIFFFFLWVCISIFMALILFAGRMLLTFPTRPQGCGDPAMIDHGYYS